MGPEEVKRIWNCPAAETSKKACENTFEIITLSLTTYQR